MGQETRGLDKGRGAMEKNEVGRARKGKGRHPGKGRAERGRQSGEGGGKVRDGCVLVNHVSRSAIAKPPSITPRRKNRVRGGKGEGRAAGVGREKRQGKGGRVRGRRVGKRGREGEEGKGKRYDEGKRRK